MRFLALETDIRKLKRQFLAEGEEELLTTSHHIYNFLLPMLWIAPVTIAIVFMWIELMTRGADPFFVTTILYVWLLIALGLALDAFIKWRYRFLIITTEKIVLVEHKFIFSHQITPVPIENITSAHTASQFLGIGNCGRLTLNLVVMKGGTNEEIHIRTVPKPDVIAGVIENARVLKGQRVAVDQGPTDQTEKVQDVKEKAVAKIKGDAEVLQNGRLAT